MRVQGEKGRRSCLGVLEEVEVDVELLVVLRVRGVQLEEVALLLHFEPALASGEEVLPSKLRGQADDAEVDPTVIAHPLASSEEKVVERGCVDTWVGFHRSPVRGSSFCTYVSSVSDLRIRPLYL